MTKERKAELCDAMLLKFKGDIAVYWKHLQAPQYSFNDIVKDTDSEFGSSGEDKYYVIESHINFLVSEDMLHRVHQNMEGHQCLKLTDKGYSTMTDLKNLGYVEKERQILKDEKEKRNTNRLNKIIQIAILIISIASLIAVLCKK